MSATVLAFPVPERNSEAIAAWVLSMQASGLSPSTIKARTVTLSRLEVVTGCDPLEATTGDLATMLAQPRLSQATRCSQYSNLKAWFGFLVETGRRLDDPLRPLRKPKTPRHLPRPMDRDLVGHLLGLGGRVRTYTLLGAYQGLRAHEIAKVRGEDVTESTLHVVGKGRVAAFLPTHPLVWEEAQRYPRRGWWFPGRYSTAEPIGAQTVTRAIMRATEKAGTPATAHMLRHLFGTEALRASGGNLRVTQELMRHASPATTAIYTLVDDTERRSAVLALPTYT